MPVSATPKLSEVRAEIRGVGYTGAFSLSEALAEAGFPADGSLSLFANYAHSLSAPNITIPTPDQNIPASDNTVTFTWDSVIGATEYEWELRDGLNGSGFLADSGTVYTNSITWTPNGGLQLDALVGIDGSFRVRAKNDTMTSDWSGWVNFSVT